jgi:polyribonucleotide nucleotidyltransferase
MEVKLHEVESEIDQDVRQFCHSDLVEAVKIAEKQARQEQIDQIQARAIEHFKEVYADKPENIKDVKEVLYEIVKEEVRRLITHDKVRPDGRALDEIRPID